MPEQLQRSKKLLMKMPRALFQPDLHHEEREAFFHSDAIMQASEEVGQYQSMKAVLRLGDGEGDEADITSIVDSGAAWCAIRLSYLKENLPKLIKKIKQSNKLFKDASNRPMSLVGELVLSLKIGTLSTTTKVYVFGNLGADFLLGANALHVSKSTHHERLGDDPSCRTFRLPTCCTHRT